jgi:histidinol-phosphate aminotransferase
MKPPAPVARLAELPRYQPGRSSEAAMAEHGLASAIKLASNESPFGPLPRVAQAIATALQNVNRYPDHTAEALRERFAAHVGVSRERVACGPGSVGLLEQLALAYVDHGDEVVYPWPSFVAYPQFTFLAGGAESTVPLTRQAFDADSVVAAISERTRVVLLATPNNPTSTALRTAELQRIVDAAPADCLVVVDEAYHEFVTGADVPDAVELFADRPNVAVLRTLSKAYGLAGLRVGFLVADPAVVDAVNACAIPFGVNAAAQAAGLAALDEHAEVVRRCSVVTTQRWRVAKTLRRRGLGVPASEANFWWLPAGSATAALGLALERRGVVARPLDGGVRVTVGTSDDNNRFLDALGDAVDSDPALTADWRTATGAHAVAAADWLDRLEAALARYRKHLAVDHPRRTDPVPGEDETWDDRQVWAHVAEFGDYWLAELTALLDAAVDEPPPFGRTRRNADRIAAIASGRHAAPAEHLRTIERSADRLAALLAGMTDQDWDRRGRHETLGVMDLDAQLRHFHVGHYEEHADQLDLIALPAPPPTPDTA